MDDWQIAIHGKWVIRSEMGAGIDTKATWHTGADTTCIFTIGIWMDTIYNMGNGFCNRNMIDGRHMRNGYQDWRSVQK